MICILHLEQLHAERWKIPKHNRTNDVRQIDIHLPQNFRFPDTRILSHAVAEKNKKGSKLLLGTCNVYSKGGIVFARAYKSQNYHINQLDSVHVYRSANPHEIAAYIFGWELAFTIHTSGGANNGKLFSITTIFYCA